MRGFQRGTASFGTSTAMAALELTNRMVRTIQVNSDLCYFLLVAVCEGFHQHMTMEEEHRYIIFIILITLNLNLLYLFVLCVLCRRLLKRLMTWSLQCQMRKNPKRLNGTHITVWPISQWTSEKEWPRHTA